MNLHRSLQSNANPSSEVKWNKLEDNISVCQSSYRKIGRTPLKNDKNEKLLKTCEP